MPKLSERRKNMILINQSKNAPFFCPTLLAKPNCKDLLPGKQVARKCQSRENKGDFNTQKDLFLTVVKHIGREKTAHFARNVQILTFFLDFLDTQTPLWHAQKGVLFFQKDDPFEKIYR